MVNMLRLIVSATLVPLVYEFLRTIYLKAGIWHLLCRWESPQSLVDFELIDPQCLDGDWRGGGVITSLVYCW